MTGGRRCDAVRSGTELAWHSSKRRTRPRRILALLRGRSRPVLYGKRNKRGAALGRAEPDAVRQGRHRRGGRPWPDGACQPGRSRGRRSPPTTDSTSSRAQTETILLRLSPERVPDSRLTDAEQNLRQPIAEADAFYAASRSGRLTEDEARVQRQALAGLIWSKQYYNYDVAQWLDGDPAGPPPPQQRESGRNSEWRHHSSGDVISMPDKWEYPWYAAWDLAFHCVAFGLVDPRVRQGSAPAADARAVHAPQRPASGLRMGLRRRQSAGPHRGGPGALPG